MSDTTIKNIELPAVAETALLTLYCHAIESQAPEPILKDDKAVEITRLLESAAGESKSPLIQDRIKKRLNSSLVVFITMRARKFDEYAKSFLSKNPDGVIVNIGCGMDSRFNRIDNGQVQFFDLDLPEMIDFKKQFFRESTRYHFLAASVLDFHWIDQVTKLGKRPVLFLAEGVFMYLDADKVKELVLKLQSRFPGCELVCEVTNSLFTRPPWNKMVGMKMQHYQVSKDAIFHFGLSDSREMETWHEGIQFLEDWSYFDTHHPRLGAMGMMGKVKFMRNVQYTVHYRLN
jgi:methyltransferase (TIGR00027 family)